MGSDAQKTVTIASRNGLHARPATVLVERARSFASDVYLVANDEEVDGKSIISILTLGLGQGAKITVRASGDDAEEAVEALAELLTSTIPLD